MQIIAIENVSRAIFVDDPAIVPARENWSRLLRKRNRDTLPLRFIVAQENFSAHCEIDSEVATTCWETNRFVPHIDCNPLTRRSCCPWWSQSTTNHSRCIWSLRDRMELESSCLHAQDPAKSLSLTWLRAGIRSCIRSSTRTCSSKTSSDKWHQNFHPIFFWNFQIITQKKSTFLIFTGVLKKKIKIKL